MTYKFFLQAAVVACLCGVMVMLHHAGPADPSMPRLDSPLLVAQTPAASATSETTPTDAAASAAEFAQKLFNPIASLISVPFQSNFDFNLGQDNDKFKYTLNIQPVIPLSISADWNLIARIIQPVIYQEELFPGQDNNFGLGDMNPEFFSEAHQWTVPLGLFASQVLKVGSQPLNLQFGPRVYLDGPSGGPEWGLRFNVVLLFPK